MEPSRTAVVEAAYRVMATDANYRPEAPGDGGGNITVPEDELDLDSEARRYAARFDHDERASNIGVANYSTIQPTIFATEAARLMCGGRTGNDVALRLLSMAKDTLDQALAR